jgi:anti-sigma28 factor (negative regulator of flagellin synthesis)
MKIFDRSPVATPQSDVARSQESSRTARSDSSRAAANASASGSGDTIQLSTAAGSVRNALDAAAGARTGRISALQASYRAGAYVPDSRETSRAMVNEGLAGASA